MKDQAEKINYESSGLELQYEEKEYKLNVIATTTPNSAHSWVAKQFMDRLQEHGMRSGTRQTPIGVRTQTESE